MNYYHIGQLEIGDSPRIVGTLSKQSSLPSRRPTCDYICDVVEVRLDMTGADTDKWVKECQAIEAVGLPVLLTLRLAVEGGQWNEPDMAREAILFEALEKLSCVDVELTSSLHEPLCRRALELGKCVIVSVHDFKRTPCFDELKNVRDRILDIPNAIPKISTMINDRADVYTLIRLLETDSPRPVCVVGMGSMGIKTRVILPAIGSCLTYGYIDEPSAPGQLGAKVLTDIMLQLLPDHGEI